MKIKGWSGYPEYNVNITTPKCVDDIILKLKKGNLIARGNGRSYGDSAININNTISMKNFNKIISFDEKSGTLVAESGILLVDINGNNSIVIK